MKSVKGRYLHKGSTFENVSIARREIPVLDDSLNSVNLLPPSMKFRVGNVFTPVCDSVHWGGGVLCGGLCPGGLCPWGSLSMGVSVHRVSVQGVSVQGISIQGESLSREGVPVSVSVGVSVQGVSVQGVSIQGVSIQGSLSKERGPCQGDPPYGNVRVVRILLECILVESHSGKSLLTKEGSHYFLSGRKLLIGGNVIAPRHFYMHYFSQAETKLKLHAVRKLTK